MKKRIIFLLLFSMLFTFFAAAEKVNYSSFGDADEACTKGYRNGIYDEYEYYSDNLSESESDLQLRIIDYVCENFESGMDPEEYDSEIIKQAYDYGYAFGIRDYHLITRTIEMSRESIYQEGYNSAAAKAKLESYETEAQLEDQYEAGYSDGQNSVENSIENKIGVFILGSIFCIAVYGIIYAIWKFICSIFKGKQ